MITTGPDLAAVVDDLRGRGINYDEALAPPHVIDGWHQDRWTVELGYELPGEPAPGGLVAAADAMVNGYEFTDRACCARCIGGRPRWWAATCCCRAGSRCSGS